MNDLLRKIYEEISVYSEDSYETNQNLENEVGNMIAPHTMKLTGKEKEELEDVFFDVCDKGKYVGFTLGMKCCFKLIQEFCDKGKYVGFTLGMKCCFKLIQELLSD